MVQGHMNGAPNETQTDLWRFASLAPEIPTFWYGIVDFVSVSLVNGIPIFMGYLMSKLSF